MPTLGTLPSAIQRHIAMILAISDAVAGFSAASRPLRVLHPYIVNALSRRDCLARHPLLTSSKVFVSWDPLSNYKIARHRPVDWRARNLVLSRHGKHPRVTSDPRLRFHVGQRVLCNLAQGADEYGKVTRWVYGKVTRHYIRLASWPEGSVAPYEIMVENPSQYGFREPAFVHAPMDDDSNVRSCANSSMHASMPPSIVPGSLLVPPLPSGDQCWTVDQFRFTLSVVGESGDTLVASVPLQLGLNTDGETKTPMVAFTANFATPITVKYTADVQGMGGEMHPVRYVIHARSSGGQVAHFLSFTSPGDIGSNDMYDDYCERYGAQGGRPGSFFRTSTVGVGPGETKGEKWMNCVEFVRPAWIREWVPTTGHTLKVEMENEGVFTSPGEMGHPEPDWGSDEGPMNYDYLNGQFKMSATRVRLVHYQQLAGGIGFGFDNTGPRAIGGMTADRLLIVLLSLDWA